MKRLAIFLATTALSMPASAATMTMSVVGDSADGNEVSVFDFSTLISTELANGFDVVFTGGTLAISGYSPYSQSPESRYFRDSDWYSGSCDFWGCSSGHWDYYYDVYRGDRSSEYVRAIVDGTTVAYDNNYTPRTRSSNSYFQNGDHIIETIYTYNYYGAMSDVEALSGGTLAALNASGILDVTVTNTGGNRVQNVLATLKVDYDLVQRVSADVPLPATAALLAGAVSLLGMGGFARRRRG